MWQRSDTCAINVTDCVLISRGVHIHNKIVRTT